MSERRFSRTVHARHGALHGWCEHCPEESRHEALRRSVKADGYATTVRRLNFLHNVANRQANGGLRGRAREDERWLERMHAEGMV